MPFATSLNSWNVFKTAANNNTSYQLETPTLLKDFNMYQFIVLTTKTKTVWHDFKESVVNILARMWAEKSRNCGLIFGESNRFVSSQECPDRPRGSSSLRLVLEALSAGVKRPER